MGKNDDFKRGCEGESERLSNHLPKKSKIVQPAPIFRRINTDKKFKKIIVNLFDPCLQRSNFISILIKLFLTCLLIKFVFLEL